MGGTTDDHIQGGEYFEVDPIGVTHATLAFAVSVQDKKCRGVPR